MSYLPEECTEDDVNFPKIPCYNPVYQVLFRGERGGQAIFLGQETRLTRQGENGGYRFGKRRGEGEMTS
jgi:hypothetical protein